MSFKKNKKTVISLFSGCGGMDLGFEGGFFTHPKSVKNRLWIDEYGENGQVKLKQTGFETIFACDIKPSAKKAWEAYFDRDVFHLESIVDLVKKAKTGEFEFPSADVVTGGFPCQDFSVAGKRNGLKSTKGHDMSTLDEPSVESRGMLYYWMREVVSLVKPKVFIAENVKGLVSLADVKETIVEDFRSVAGGYIVLDPQVLHAGEYGVPQSRERVIFIGIRKDTLSFEALEGLQNGSLNYNPYPKKTHSLKVEIVTAMDVLCDLSEPEHSEDVSQQFYSKAKWYGKHCQGQTEVNLKGLAPTIRSEHHGNIEFRRLSLENGGKIEDEFDLPQRRLSVRECARIQTFPDDFAFVGNGVCGSAAYKLVGNAVPPLLAYHIAKRLDELWESFFEYGEIHQESRVA
jgi:DNA (cytosine-5)-methyltransferase 1